MPIGEVKTLMFSDGVAVTAPAQQPVAKQITDAVGWTGSATSVTYDTTAVVPDARLTSWVLKNASYEQVLAKVSSATQYAVTIQADEPLPAGTYYLFGTY